LNNIQANLAAPNGHGPRGQEAARAFGTPDEEISHLKMTIAYLSKELEVERIRHRRTSDGARLLDDCVWDLQRRLEKARRPFFLRWPDAALDLAHSSRETASRLLRRAMRATRFLLASAREALRSLEPAAQSTILLLMPVAKQQWAGCGRACRKLIALKRPIRDKLHSFDWPRVQRP
jgi:hypothetical protein